MTYQEFLRNRFNKASDLLLFLVDVIENPPSNFEWDMDSFGNEKIVRGRFVCVGCAATCAVLKLAELKDAADLKTGKLGASLTADSRVHRAKILGLSVAEQNEIEDFFDRLRQGYIDVLSELTALSIPEPVKVWYFGNHNKEDWGVELGKVKAYIEKIKALGF